MPTPLLDFNARMRNGTKGLELVIVSGGRLYGGAAHYELRRNSGDYSMVRTLDPAQFPVGIDPTVTPAVAADNTQVPPAILTLVANSTGLPRGTNI